MARLPITGSDDGVWGDVLNAYLQVAHTNTGAIKDGAISSSAIQDGSIGSSKLSDTSVGYPKLSTSNSASNGQVLSYNGSGLAWTTASGSSDPALGGDLSGVASSAQIVANAVGATELATNAVTTVKITDSNVTAAKLSSTAVTPAKIDSSNAAASGKAIQSNGTNFTWIDMAPLLVLGPADSIPIGTAVGTVIVRKSS